VVALTTPPDRPGNVRYPDFLMEDLVTVCLTQTLSNFALDFTSCSTLFRALVAAAEGAQL